MRRVFLLLLLAATLAPAQQPAADKKPPASKPASTPTPAAKPDAATPATEPAFADISGTYSFLKDAEYVQINLEDDGRVTGFVSRFGELESDMGAFLDHFFEKASLSGNKFSFTTKKTHGVWFEFAGTAERGLAKTPAEEGYYVLKGRLTQYTTDAAGKPQGRFREVVFKSLPVDPAPPPAPATTK